MVALSLLFTLLLSSAEAARKDKCKVSSESKLPAYYSSPAAVSSGHLGSSLPAVSGSLRPSSTALGGPSKGTLQQVGSSSRVASILSSSVSASSRLPSGSASSRLPASSICSKRPSGSASSQRQSGSASSRVPSGSTSQRPSGSASSRVPSGHTSQRPSGSASSRVPSNSISQRPSGSASSRVPSGTASSSRPASSNASSSSRSSSRSSSSSYKPAASRSGTGTCPSVSTTLRTLSYDSFAYEYTITSTVTPTTYYWPAYTTQTFYVPAFESTVARTIITEARATFTSVIFEVVPAKSTVTVPQAPGFTPVRCEAPYFNPTKTIIGTSSITGTSTIYETAPTTTISYTTTYTAQTFLPPTTSANTITTEGTWTTTIYPTITSTTTRNNPTTTVYEACTNPDNYTPEQPPDKYPYMYQPVPRSGTYSSVIPILDGLDCCNACHSNENCTSSAFYSDYVFFVNLETRLLKPVCQLFLKNDSSTCDQRLIGAEQTQQWLEPKIFVSNGPCGQMNFTQWLPLT